MQAPTPWSVQHSVGVCRVLLACTNLLKYVPEDACPVRNACAAFARFELLQGMSCHKQAALSIRMLMPVGPSALYYVVCECYVHLHPCLLFGHVCMLD